jgi:ABC-type nickel/cobalt efflux system permease component RcnA
MGDPMGLFGDVGTKGFGIGALVAALWLGFQHGIDWDHIAAITDITSSQEERRQSLVLGTLYAAGHGLVVLLIGSAAILAGRSLPESVDNVMTRIVGVTLLLLGVYVVYSLIRHGRDFRLRSRWMLIFAGVRRGRRWVRERVGARERVVARVGGPLQEGHAASGSEGVDPSLWHHGHHGRPGHHHHARPEREDMFSNYTKRTAFVVGMIHGVGGETPSQVIIFTTAAGIGGGALGVVVLVAFLVGLFSSNTMITVGSAFGYLRATRHFAIYATVGVLTAVFSLTIGTIFVLGDTSILPSIMGGH